MSDPSLWVFVARQRRRALAVAARFITLAMML
jgi:hypothetical protein